MRALAVFALVAVLGCGGARSGAGASTPGGDSTENEVAPDAAAVETGAPADAAAPAPALLSEAECAQMVDHMIDVQLAERERQAQPLPDPGELDEIRRGIAAEFLPQCAGIFERALYDCWMGANSHAEFESCAGGPPPPQD